MTGILVECRPAPTQLAKPSARAKRGKTSPTNLGRNVLREPGNRLHGNANAKTMRIETSCRGDDAVVGREIHGCCRCCCADRAAADRAYVLEVRSNMRSSSA